MVRWLIACALVAATGQIILPPIPGQTAGAQTPGKVPNAPSPRPNPAPAPSAIVGNVVDSKSGRGIAKAVVRLLAASGSVVQTRLADDRGRFYFKGIPPGDFTIDVERLGYFKSSFGQRRASGNGTAITIGANSVVGNLRVEIFRPSVIAGSVLDEAGEALIGVPVHALRREYVNGAWRFDDAGTDDTDDRGEYRLADLIPGDYVVVVPAVKVSLPNETAERADATGDVPPGLSAVLGTFLTAPQNGVGMGMSSYVVFDRDQLNLLLAGRGPTPPPRSNTKIEAYPHAYYVGSDILRLAMPITIAPGETRTAVVFQLRPVPTARISGRLMGSVSGLSGRPLRLLVDGDDDLGFGTEVAVTLTAKDGAFTFLDVPQGRYVIEARNSWAPASADSADPIIFGNDLGTEIAGWARQPVFVTDEDIANLVVTLTPPANLIGSIVYDTALSKAPVPAGLMFTLAPVGASISSLPRAHVDGNHRFVLGGLPPGRYVLRTTGMPYGWTMKSAVFEGTDIADRWFELRAGSDAQELVVTLTDRITKTIGTVRDVRGVTQPTATVLAFPSERRDLSGAGVAPHRLRAARVSGAAVFRIDGLPPGDYVFIAIDDAEAQGWQDEARLAKLAPLGTRVTLRDGEQRTIDLRQISVKR